MYYSNFPLITEQQDWPLGQNKWVPAAWVGPSHAEGKTLNNNFLCFITVKRSEESRPIEHLVPKWVRRLDVKSGRFLLFVPLLYDKTRHRTNLKLNLYNISLKQVTTELTIYTSKYHVNKYVGFYSSSRVPSKVLGRKKIQWCCVRSTGFGQKKIGQV